MTLRIPTDGGRRFLPPAHPTLEIPRPILPTVPVEPAEGMTCSGGNEEFFPARKSFTLEHKAWRKSVLKLIAENPDLFPKALPGQTTINRDRLDEDASRLQAISSILAVLHQRSNRKASHTPLSNDARRVLNRLGMMRELGFNLTNKRKQNQAMLEDLIPPALRQVLSSTLNTHGQQVCQESPKCGSCALKRFCTSYRTKQASAAERSSKPTVVDLFCGAGGLSEGFHQAGFRTVLAVDQTPVAIRTYRLNHPEVPEDRVLCEDLRDFSKDAKRLREVLGKKQRVDVLIGGPPCQGFSRAGWRSRGNGQRFKPSEDDRNHLYAELINLLEQLKPKIVLMENVPGIGEVCFPDGSTFQDVTMQAMRERGYMPTTWTLNAAHYGVPQLRFRRVIIGVRNGKKAVNPPVAQYSASSNQFRHSNQQPGLFETLEPAITLMEAIQDLQRLEIDDGTWVATHQRPRTPSRYLKAFGITHPQGLMFSHISRFQNETDLQRFDGLEPGETYMDLIRKHPTLENYRTDAFDDKYYRLEPNTPSRTIVAHLRKDGNSFVHPDQRRSLSVREAAPA